MEENYEAIGRELKEMNKTPKPISDNLAEVNEHLAGLEGVIARALLQTLIGNRTIRREYLKV